LLVALWWKPSKAFDAAVRAALVIAAQQAQHLAKRSD
jgi:hypothetical protein